VRRSPLSRRSTLRRGRPPRRRTPLARKQSLHASPAQQAKVAGQVCAVCRATPVDPAHLILRSLGGCDEPACVVPLCRRHHRAFDTRRLDLLAWLEPGHREELAHAVGHLGLAAAVRRVGGGR
jgi:hypothetical protein